MCQRHGSNQTPTLLLESKNHVSINLYDITYAVIELCDRCNRMFLMIAVHKEVDILSLKIICHESYKFLLM